MGQGSREKLEARSQKQEARNKKNLASRISHLASYGIAFDIGTTTIAGVLIDLETFKEIDAASAPNPQARFGKDIISRVQRIIDDPSNLQTLQHDVISACNSIIHAIARDVEDIKLITAAGNSVMEHIFLGISPAPLARVPYRPVFKDAGLLSAKALDLDLLPDTQLYTFPLIGGFIGGDTVAVILATNIHMAKGVSLAIDIGTNSEIVLSSDGKLYATSAAAGPAFEGGRIRCGMIARDGAIQAVKIDNERVILDVIGGSTPAGICGTGLLDAIAWMLRADILDTSGRIKNRDEVQGNIANKIIETKDGNSFLLYRDSKREISITQQDVRELQLAKGAIQAGIRLLLKRAGVDDIDRIYLAGAFGSSLKKDSLAQIGVLESRWLDKVIFVGDAALDGARLALCSEEKRREAEDIAKKARHISLSGSAHFQKEFMKGMEFPD